MEESTYFENIDIWMLAWIKMNTTKMRYNKSINNNHDPLLDIDRKLCEYRAIFFDIFLLDIAIWWNSNTFAVSTVIIIITPCLIFACNIYAYVL